MHYPTFDFTKTFNHEPIRFWLFFFTISPEDWVLSTRVVGTCSTGVLGTAGPPESERIRVWGTCCCYRLGRSGKRPLARPGIWRPQKRSMTETRSRRTLETTKRENFREMQTPQCDNRLKLRLPFNFRRPKQLCSTSCRTNAVLPVPGSPVTATPDDWAWSIALLMSWTSHSRPRNNGSDSCWGTSKNSGFSTRSCCCCCCWSWSCCCCGEVLYWANRTARRKTQVENYELTSTISDEKN